MAARCCCCQHDDRCPLLLASQELEGGKEADKCGGLLVLDIHIDEGSHGLRLLLLRRVPLLCLNHCRSLEIKVLKELDKCDFLLDDGELSTCACARPVCEWEVGILVWLALLPALGPKLSGILAPELLVVMHGHDPDQDHGL